MSNYSSKSHVQYQKTTFRQFQELLKNISGAAKINNLDFRKNFKIDVEAFGKSFKRNGKNKCY